MPLKTSSPAAACSAVYTPTCAERTSGSWAAAGVVARNERVRAQPRTGKRTSAFGCMRWVFLGKGPEIESRNLLHRPGLSVRSGLPPMLDELPGDRQDGQQDNRNHHQAKVFPHDRDVAE